MQSYLAKALGPLSLLFPFLECFPPSSHSAYSLISLCLFKCHFPNTVTVLQVTSVVSDSVRPHRRQPTRLPHPWDSQGKNTGVGCRFLLQYMKVKSESEVAQSCPTLSDPMDCSLLGSSIHGIFQAGVLEWGAIALTPCLNSIFKITTPPSPCAA